MFIPTERHNLVDMLRPPPNYRLDAAVGTSYSMDFVSLTAVMLAFLDTETYGDGENNQTEALHGITRLSDRVRLYVNRGGIRTFPSDATNRVCCLYDGIVREVSFRQGCFHPKIWLARYTPKRTPSMVGQPIVVRVVCSSKNLTASSHWEDFVAFEGIEQERRTRSRVAGELRSFVRWLSTCSPGQPLATMMATLQRTDFPSAAQCRDALEFVWQKPGGRALWDSVPEEGDRALVVSPFIRKTIIEDLFRRFRRITLVASQRELDQIEDDGFHISLARLATTYVLREEGIDSGDPGLPLHAKLFIFEGDFGQKAYIGSANASSSAWKARNCEALVGFSPGISVQRFEKEFLRDDKGNLRSFVIPYERQVLERSSQEDAQEKLDAFRDAFCRAKLQARYQLSNQQLTLTARSSDLLKRGSQSPESMMASSPLLHLQICPLPLFNSRSDLVDGSRLFATGVVFGAIGVADLSQFFVIELSHAELEVPSTIVLKATTDFDEKLVERSEALLRQLLTREKFEEFLRSILFDVVRRPPPPPPRSSQSGQGSSPFGLLLGGASLEDVLQSCTEDRTRVEEIDRLLRAFSGAGFIDPAFASFWKQFRSVLDDLGGGTDRG